MVTVDDDLVLRVELACTLYKLPHRDEQRAFETRDRVLPRLAHIEQGDRPALPQPTPETFRIELEVGVDLRLVFDSAELLVVDQFGLGRALRADRTGRGVEQRLNLIENK